MATQRSRKWAASLMRRDKSYFEDRQLVRHANVWHLWALGVGAVISGHFSGWNFGFATGGWGGMLVAGIIIAIMYLGLVFSHRRDEPGAAAYGRGLFLRPHRDGAVGRLHHRPLRERRICRDAGGDRLLHRLLCRRHLSACDAASAADLVDRHLCHLPGAQHLRRRAVASRVTLIVTLLSLAVLVIFWISAIPNMDFSRWALNIGVGPDGAAWSCRRATARRFPFGFSGVLATLPFAVWLFLAIEQLPLAAEESVDPKRDMPRGIILGMLTLMVSAFMIVLLNPSVIGVGSFKLGTSGEPLLDGFRAIYGDCRRGGARPRRAGRADRELPHDPVRQGRQIYSLSPRRLFPVGAVGDTRDLQDAACRDDRRRHRRPRHHADHVVRAGRRRRPAR